MSDIKELPAPEFTGTEPSCSPPPPDEFMLDDARDILIKSSIRVHGNEEFILRLMKAYLGRVEVTAAHRQAVTTAQRCYSELEQDRDLLRENVEERRGYIARLETELRELSPKRGVHETPPEVQRHPRIFKPEKPLSVIMRYDRSPDAADTDIAASKEGLVIRDNAPEMYFHQLRLRCAQDPELMKRIQVLYEDENGDYHEIGLGYEDELRWASFGYRAWEIETEISRARHDGTAETAVLHSHTWSTEVEERLVHCVECGFFPLGASENAPASPGPRDVPGPCGHGIPQGTRCPKCVPCP